jgi:hypothetical protein
VKFNETTNPGKAPPAKRLEALQRLQLFEISPQRSQLHSPPPIGGETATTETTVCKREWRSMKTTWKKPFFKIWDLLLTGAYTQWAHRHLHLTRPPGGSGAAQAATTTTPSQPVGWCVCPCPGAAAAGYRQARQDGVSVQANSIGNEMEWDLSRPLRQRMEQKAMQLIGGGMENKCNVS